MLPRKALSLILILAITISIFSMYGKAQNTNSVLVIEFNEQVDPGAVHFFQESFQEASSQGITNVIIEMNTPGGLLSSMTSIVNIINNGEQNGISVTTYVPPGALAASAGSYIAMASDFILMGNGSEIGPSTPIVVGGSALQQNHTENAMISFMQSLASAHKRNASAAAMMVIDDIAYTPQQALKNNLINGISNSLPDVLSKLGISGYNIIYSSPSITDQIISFLSNPMVDGILFLIGIAAVLIDLFHPTIILSISGIIIMGLAFYGTQLIGANIIGLMLLIIAAFLIIFEFKVGHGIFIAAGVILMIVGSYILLDGMEYSPAPFTISYYTMVAIMIIIGILVGLYIRWIRKALNKKPYTGSESLIGMEGKVVKDFDPEGEVKVDGIIWKAKSVNNTRYKAGDTVKVVKIDSITLIVDDVNNKGSKDNKSNKNNKENKKIKK
ncbi:MAG: NfeD family protein [Thermoplasmata archaeon]